MVTSKTTPIFKMLPKRFRRIVATTNEQNTVS